MKYSVRYGGKKGRKLSFGIASDMIAVRCHESPTFEHISRSSRSPESVASLTEVCRFDEANVRVMRVPSQRAVSRARDSARSALKPLPGVRFAGRTLMDPRSKRPVLYTENFFGGQASL